MSDTDVFVIDTVVTKPGRAREFVDRYLAEYAPGAAQRGMELVHLLVSPPIWFTDEANTVTAIWRLDGPQAWWEMTWKGRPDKRLGEWWSRMEPMIANRTRSMASAAADVEKLCDV